MADQCTARNIPLGLSTAASIPLENMRQLAGDNAWFQLYASGSTEQTMSFVERAKQAGYQKLILTVDVPQVSRRVRDHKNGFEVPFRIGPKQFLDFALHPQWSLSMLWHGIPETANYKHPSSGGFDRNSSRAGADWAFLDQLRRVWSRRPDHQGRHLNRRRPAYSSGWRRRHLGLEPWWPPIGQRPTVSSIAAPDPGGGWARTIR